jgi:hypothetical protein
MTVVAELCELLASSSHRDMASPHMQHVVCLLLQQANGKIDRTRELACHKLQVVLHCK